MVEERTTGPCFDESKWIAVLDTERCEHSKEQHSTIKDSGMSMGVLYCNDHRDVELCKRVHAFPAFCTREEGKWKCMYGKAHSKDDLERKCTLMDR